MALMNTPKFYEHGPVRMADLRRQAAAAEAMGNIAGARILLAQVDVIEDHWMLMLDAHAPAPKVYNFSGKPSAKIDTQGR